MSKREKRFDVIGLGVCTLDLVLLVDDFPAAESVQRAHASILQGGGPVATAMAALARLGSRTAMIDRIGDDWRGRMIREEFEREGVCTDHLLTCEGAASSIATVLVRKRDGARTIVYSPGDAGDLGPSDLPVEAVSSAKVLHLNGRHPKACIAAARIARSRGVPVSLDGGAHRYTPEILPLVSLSDICIVAREFAFAFAGTDDLSAAASALLEAGPALVAVTAGTEGSFVFEKGGGSFHQPAFAVENVVDTTGAGDAYHGAFLHGIVRGYPARSCALLASAVAAMNTRGLGGRSALPSMEGARRFVADRGIAIDQPPSEDEAGLSAYRDRAAEPVLAYEEFVKELKKNGKI